MKRYFTHWEVDWHLILLRGVAFVQFLQDVLQKVPGLFDIEVAQVKYPIMWGESMNTVLYQELVRYNGLLETLKPSLDNLKKAIKGLVVMSTDLEDLGKALFFGRVPELWLGKSYPSLKPLAGYVLDLVKRLEMFQKWVEDAPPPVFWMPGFFFTQAFLTGTLQNFARKYTVPIDNVAFDFEMMAKEWYRNKPTDGNYVKGLYLEGAQWDVEEVLLVEQSPKVLFTLAPTMWLKPAPETEMSQYPFYDCPVYKTSERWGMLSTTGHSTNFVMMVRLPSNKPKEHWIQRGVAMLTQLDD